MKRVSMMLLAVSMSMAVAAQNTQTANTAGGQQQAQPQSQTVIVPLVTNSNGVSTNTGTAVIVAPPSSPLVVTPEFHLAATAPSIGATNATAGNTAGAMNSTSQLAVWPRVITTVPEFSNAGAAVNTGNFETGVTGGAANGTTGLAGNGVFVLGQSARFDRGVGSGSMLAAGGDTDGRSLGEIARDNRQQAAGANARVYTNKDIDRINAQPTTNIGGISGAAVGAAGSAPNQQPSSMPAVAQPTNPPSNSNPGVSRPVPPR